MSENKSRTFFQYPVAESTEIVDEIPTAWRHGTCSPVNGWAAVELMLELTDDKPLQNHFRHPDCHTQNMLSNFEQIYYRFRQNEGFEGSVHDSVGSFGVKLCTSLTNRPIHNKLSCRCN